MEPVLAALLIGLAGGVHCVGMCGGIVAGIASSARNRAGVLVAYQLGRIGTYTAFGALAGMLGSAALLASSILPVQRALYALTALALVALGLYMAGITRVLAPVERAGAVLWRHIAPISRQLVPARTPVHAAALGAVWGFVPCGLVYSVLATALVSGDPARGALVMLAFGAGTLPHMLAASVILDRLKVLRTPAARRAIGAVIVLLGFWGLLHLVHSH